MYPVKQTEPPSPDTTTISQPPPARPQYRHPELVSGSALTQQTPDTEINPA
ncbi:MULTISPECIES: hypothetical protein [unclassified Colwellia]|uniref:hypothetical protein n=1 Tax=unclassified Colwellia TaxID=196834 RepID=UPI0015F45855|nr:MULTISPECIES: hypothetical protein [unclassified Colwellia]MBA6379110.1 hypothetical protein [Colwellia sp. BRX10-7]MBA6387168.1 hypothetical protein [Colwellia sp. BRX10-2]MBA6400041.1 hypothetical protein [Colwellia sp. BRX10-5]MBA6403920.1 hypothetical protein [Colwellia sp. BRX10-1]